MRIASAQWYTVRWTLAASNSSPVLARVHGAFSCRYLFVYILLMVIKTKGLRNTYFIYHVHDMMQCRTGIQLIKACAYAISNAF